MTLKMKMLKTLMTLTMRWAQCEDHEDDDEHSRENL